MAASVKVLTIRGQPFCRRKLAPKLIALLAWLLGLDDERQRPR